MPDSVSVISLREKTGKRLLSLALEITVQIQCESRTELETVRQRLSNEKEGLSAMLPQVGLRIQSRNVVGKGAAAEAQDALDGQERCGAYRNGYSLR